MQKIIPFPWSDDQVEGGEKQQRGRFADRSSVPPQAVPAALRTARGGR
jgi:hypothetical protein